MIKLSRPVVYSFVGAVAVYAIVLLTQPDAPTTRHIIRVATRPSADTDADDITPQDLSAHFPRYAIGKRDPFVPKVVPANAAASPGSGLGKARDPWALTGINVINDTPEALVENSAANDSVFLKRGDHWRGLRVLSIESDAVVFENALGQQTRLAFAAPPAEPTGPHLAGGNPGLQALRVVGPVPPMPVVGPLPPLSRSTSPTPGRPN